MTSERELKLAPCPLCESEAKINIPSSNSTEGVDAGLIECVNCKLNISYGWPTIYRSRVCAITAWNTRPSQALEFTEDEVQNFNGVEYVMKAKVDDFMAKIKNVRGK